MFRKNIAKENNIDIADVKKGFINVLIVKTLNHYKMIKKN